MRLFKMNKKINWKYILGELLLIFLGINLAIWFNNWNSSLAMDKNKETALERIEEEVKNNQQELSQARQTNQLFLESFQSYQHLFRKDLNTLLSTPKEFSALQKKYPDFFDLTDSIPHEGGTYYYRGSTSADLALSELSEIAWGTTRSMNITNEFNYDCLYQLEGVYNLQRQVTAQNKLLTDAILNNDMGNLTRVLVVMGQLEAQLLEDYEELLADIKNCR